MLLYRALALGGEKQDRYDQAPVFHLSQVSALSANVLPQAEEEEMESGMSRWKEGHMRRFRRFSTM